MNETISWLERKNFIAVRSLVLYACMYMTYVATDKTIDFAHASKFDGMATAAIIAALTAPIMTLTAKVFQWYSESRIP